MTRESPVSPKATIPSTEVRMITIGVDAHKRVHVAVALDAAGRQLGHWKGANCARAWQELKDWAAAFGGQRVWGVEGAWSYGRGLAQHLVLEAEVVYDVNSRWTDRDVAVQGSGTRRIDSTLVLSLRSSGKKAARCRESARRTRRRFWIFSSANGRTRWPR